MVLGAPLPAGGAGEELALLEANVDDTTAEVAAYALERAMEQGALDAWVTPIGMKKGRPALKLSVLCTPVHETDLERLMLSETSTLGVRRQRVRRTARPRESLEVDTRYGPVRVKVSSGDGIAPNLAPEMEDCRRAAQAADVPLKQVYAEALAEALVQELEKSRDQADYFNEFEAIHRELSQDANATAARAVLRLALNGEALSSDASTSKTELG